MKMRQLWIITCVFGLSQAAVAQIHNISSPATPSNNQLLQQQLQQKPLSRQLLKNMASRPLLVEPVLKNYDHSNWERKSAGALPVTYFKPGETTILPKQLAQTEASLEARAKAVDYYEDLIGLYQKVAQKDGFPANSVAYAFNYYVVNNYHVLHNLLEKTDKVRVSSITPIGGNPAKGQMVTLEQERTLFRQFEQLLGDDPSIRQMNDSEKQSITESLAIMTNECFKLYQYALENDDKDVLHKAQETALNNLVQLLGERAARMRITDRGMEF